MSGVRGEFSSRMGFVMAATGSAVGLGNIWGFPTQAASNGGAAFVLVYLILAFCLAYPALIAEMLIGRHGKSNSVNALKNISNSKTSRRVGMATGFYGIIVASLILSFYAIVAGWMISFSIEPITRLLGLTSFSDWLIQFSILRNIIFCALFMLLTIFIITGGVEGGIEKWSVRLMPTLITLMIALIIYVFTLDGAAEGLKVYLLPDFSSITKPSLIIDALGQAFFSLSLGVGTMMIYGSYLSKDENLPLLGTAVTLVDIGIAVIAGFLVVPAMYVAAHNGVEIFSNTGALLSEDTLIFAVLPALFDTLGTAGQLLGFAFFTLMSIAALTSSISMLEVSVAYTMENHQMSRKKSTWIIGSIIFLISLTIIFNFEALFGFVITLTTRYSQPLLALFICLFTGWIWSRNGLLNEIKQGYPNVESSLFWKIWPHYVRYACPLFIVIMLYKTL